MKGMYVGLCWPPDLKAKAWAIDEVCLRIERLENLAAECEDDDRFREMLAELAALRVEQVEKATIFNEARTVYYMNLAARITGARDDGGGIS